MDKNNDSPQGTQNRHVPADRPLMRTTLLLAVGNAQDADVLKKGLQHADAHRIFLAADWREVLCLVQNVYVDVLILDDDLTPLPDNEVSHYLQGMKKVEALPAIILRDRCNPFQLAERAHASYIELDKPIMEEVLLKALVQLLSKQNDST
jgi:hypothetical protein